MNKTRNLQEYIQQLTKTPDINSWMVYIKHPRGWFIRIFKPICGITGDQPVFATKDEAAHHLLIMLDDDDDDDDKITKIIQRTKQTWEKTKTQHLDPKTCDEIEDKFIDELDKVLDIVSKDINGALMFPINFPDDIDSVALAHVEIKLTKRLAMDGIKFKRISDMYYKIKLLF